MSIVNNEIDKGIRFRFASFTAETPANSETAISTPETGETVRPMEAENCMGKIMEVLDTPNFVAIFGTSGPKAKNAALPLPINMAAKKINTVITMPIPVALNPKFCESSIKLSMKPKPISPLAKMSAAMIKVTTVLKIFPIPFQ